MVQKIWKLRDVRRSLLAIIGMLIVFRIGAHIPIPGIDAEAVRRMFSSNQFLGLLNVFSGGTIGNFSIMSLGVAPYVTASIILQLLSMVIPRLEELTKEGEAGQRIINQYTRIATVPLCFIQGYGIISLLKQASTVSHQPVIGTLSPWLLAVTLMTLLGGTMVLMWLGEIISEYKMGNGISVIIFAGIVSALPGRLQQGLVNFDRDQLATWVAYAAIALATILVVVVMTEGVRKIPISYARMARGSGLSGGVQTHLPLRVNPAGVIPIIFAISVVLFPPIIAQFFLRAKGAGIVAFAQKVINFFQNQTNYAVLYFILVVAFTYFYTAVIFRPDQIAENLQKQGGFIPGIRPGKPTADYLGYTLNRLLLAGSLFLGAIAVLPVIVQNVTGTRALVIGGTSLLIVVSVVIEIVNQIESQITMREYEGV